MSKKILTVTACLVLAFVVSACSKTTDTNTANNGKAANTNTTASAINQNSSGSVPSDTVVSCANVITIGDIVVEDDPIGEPEAWVRIDYTSTATQKLYCEYTLTFYNGQDAVVRTIPIVKSTFEYPSGQIHNGYPNTPFQSGMTARITIK
ncbi:MAG: hypothetical protein PHY34_00370 [Patescibacteria group bacterium]|nr:hypothetical protein [Patescibacteria group bacterium]MDD5715913.1 hypothetical protein [Patescibacteria group bacterium]